MFGCYVQAVHQKDTQEDDISNDMDFTTWIDHLQTSITHNLIRIMNFICFRYINAFKTVFKHQNPIISNF